MKHFCKLGYEVYPPLTENSTYDFLIHKDGIIKSVEVKSTSVKKPTGYEVSLKSIRSNKTSNRIIKFDNTKMDILSVYIEPEDVVKVLDPTSISNTSALVVPLD